MIGYGRFHIPRSPSPNRKTRQEAGGTSPVGEPDLALPATDAEAIVGRGGIGDGPA